jgi:hypothetical protein
VYEREREREERERERERERDLLGKHNMFLKTFRNIFLITFN